MKKLFMRQYWRIQQSQTLISMAFWCATLTLLIWPYVSWRFTPNATIGGIQTTYWGLFSISATVLLLVLLICIFCHCHCRRIFSYLRSAGQCLCQVLG